MPKESALDFFDFVRQNLSQGYRGGHTLMANDRYPHGNDNLSRISAQSYSGAEINLITWLPHRDKIFILPAGEAPPPNHVTKLQRRQSIQPFIN